MFATWFGAETIIGASGAIYTDGLAGGNADPFGYGLCLILAGLIFAVPLWKRGLTTYADLFRQRYSTGVERVMVLLYVPSSVIWGAAQIRAFGQVLGVASGLELDASILAGAVIVIIYTLLGGLMADAITDVIQGLALVIGLVVILVAVMVEAGGVSGGLALVEPDRFQPFGSGGRSPLAVMEEWAVPVLGSLLAAEILQRIIGARSASTAHATELLVSLTSQQTLLSVSPLPELRCRKRHHRQRTTLAFHFGEHLLDDRLVFEAVATAESWLDDRYVYNELVFRDGFESGDTSSWSAQVP